VPAHQIASSPARREQGSGQDAVLGRAEVRDVLAWMRLLVDPHDAAAVVRALARPPIELRQVHLALVIQLARRRKLDLVSGLAAANDSPQVPPEARERIARFVDLHARAAEALDTLGPEVFTASLIEMVCSRAHSVLAPGDAAEQRAGGLEALRQMAAGFAHRRPGSTPRELAAHLSATAPPASRSRRTASSDRFTASGREEGRPSSHDDPAQPAQPPAEIDLAAQTGEELADYFQALRAEVLAGVSRIGGRLGELRLDTELDIAHGVVRYLELLKLSALMQRRGDQEMADALADINARLLAATTPVEREIFQTSTLDETLAAGAPPTSIAPREERSFAPFLPRKGVGLALSASDIDTYRSCPLRYKFSRVLRIPTEQTRQQRFGIVVHQVLERFHAEGAQSLERMLELLDAGWQRAGLGAGEEESRLHELARSALSRYHDRLQRERAEPVWFERAFTFSLGPHQVRGRVDRVDRLPGATGDGQPDYELIDYKTSRARAAHELADDVQLSLYALAAREAWQLESSRQAYYYVLDDRKVPVPRGPSDSDAIRDVVMQAGEGILSQAFDPTPSPAACSLCDYRIVCPAAEA
jgi:RecB family exonuclease